MLSPYLKKENSSISTFGFMHKVLHNFSDWEFETCHMTRTERSIYFDMRTLYLKLGKPLTDDMELLAKRLRCVNAEEVNALNFLLKDKFRHDKKTKTYRQSEWDLILKNYKFRHKTNNDETLDEMQSEQSDETKNTNAERLKTLRQRNKKIISALNKIGIKANSRMTSKQLFELCKQHNVTLDDEIRNSDETQNTNDEIGYEQKNDAKNQAITNNHKPLTNNQINNNTLSNAQDPKTADEVLAKAQQIKQDNAQNIQNWIAPSLDEIRSMLFSAGFTGVLNQAGYERHVADFKVYYEAKALEGQNLNTDSLRKQKLRDWIMRDEQKKSKPSYQKKSQSSQFGGTSDPLAVNEKWRPGETGIVEPNTKFEFIDGQLVATPLDSSAPVQGAW